MTAVVAGLGAGALLCFLLWTAGRGVFAVDGLSRSNYRGATLATGVGVLIPVVMILASGAATLVMSRLDPNPEWARLMVPAMGTAAGFSLLGLLDDVAGVGQSGGFRGHLKALTRGQLTSGTIKLAGGAGLGIVVSTSVALGGNGAVGALRDGAVVALAANLANLLDRAPGRAIKWSTVLFLVAALTSGSAVMTAPAVGVGAGAGLLWPDLRERCMLGDAGANPLGALCGLAGLVAATTASARWGLLLALLFLNLLSESVSFGRIIDTVGPLRWFDRAGSLR